MRVELLKWLCCYQCRYGTYIYISNLQCHLQLTFYIYFITKVDNEDDKLVVGNSYHKNEFFFTQVGPCKIPSTHPIKCRNIYYWWSIIIWSCKSAREIRATNFKRILIVSNFSRKFLEVWGILTLTPHFTLRNPVTSINFSTCFFWHTLLIQ